MFGVLEAGSIDLGKTVVHYSEDPKEGGTAILAYAESDTLIMRSMVSQELKERASQIFPAEMFGWYVAEHNDLEELAPLFGNAEHRKVYATLKPLDLDQVKPIVERDINRAFTGNPWTGYFIQCKETGQVLGRGAIGSGWDPKDNTEGSYQSVLGEMQMGDFVVARLGEERESLYREVILTLLVMARHFSSAGIQQNGHSVPRYTITVIDPTKDQGIFSEDAERELQIRIKVLAEIFGEPLGELPPKSQDVRNYSEHWRLVFGCDVMQKKEEFTSEESS